MGIPFKQRWQTKSLIQRNVARLPLGHEALYYILQRYAGRLKGSHDPTENFVDCTRLVRRLQELGISVRGTRVMEVGTGWGLDFPIALYLAGADSVKTFDLHHYLRTNQVEDSLNHVRQNPEAVKRILLSVTEEYALNERLETLCKLHNVADLERVAGIQYIAPADAANTALPAESIDLHISHTVFEHVPAEVLKAILIESNRVLSKTGVAVHHIDPSDHFSHYDASISKINFLQFSDKKWKKYAGNQFAYHNRLRLPDYRRIFAECGHEVLQLVTACDERSLQDLKAGFPVHEKFRGLSPEDLCTVTASFISAPQLKVKQVWDAVASQTTTLRPATRAVAASAG